MKLKLIRNRLTKGYGEQVVERPTEDLQKELPGTAGFPPQNVWFLRSFYLPWPGMPQKPSQVVGEKAVLFRVTERECQRKNVLRRSSFFPIIRRESAHFLDYR